MNLINPEFSIYFTTWMKDQKISHLKLALKTRISGAYWRDLAEGRISLDGIFMPAVEELLGENLGRFLS
jgi:hypothetical protein